MKVISGRKGASRKKSPNATLHLYCTDSFKHSILVMHDGGYNINNKKTRMQTQHGGEYLLPGQQFSGRRVCVLL